MGVEPFDPFLRKVDFYTITEFGIIWFTFRVVKLFGLTLKERKEQFKKDVANGSFGHTRRREADKSNM
ncbi:MAG: hypothetical protein Q8R96_02100 [Bacteroidota bacterium]|nr:hypothetical protein [Bacteroidota bacterium]